MAALGKAKKGTPEYEEWLRKYREKKGASTKTEEPKTTKPAKVEVEQVVSPTPSVSNQTGNTLPKGSKGMVFSKSQNKNLMVQVIRYDESKGKYFVKREDNKFLYYSASDITTTTEEPKSSSVATPGKDGSYASIPEGSVSDKINKAVTPIAQHMSTVGMAVDKELLDNISDNNDEEIKAAEQNLTTIVGHQVNVNAPREVASLLYDELHLPITSNGRSSDADTLQELSETTSSPVPSAIIRLRKALKLKSSYIDKLKAVANRGDGKLRNIFDTTAVSGRFTASGNPVQVTVDLPDEIASKLEDKVYTPQELKSLGIKNVCNL